MADESTVGDDAVAFVHAVQSQILSVLDQAGSLGALVVIAWVSPDNSRDIDIVVQHSCSIKEAGPELAERARQALVRFQAQEFNGATGLKS